MSADKVSGFVCPACRSTVNAKDDAFGCSSCGRSYPVLFGIPDFRLQGDRYLSLEAERAKAARLHEFGRNHDLKAVVDYYYSITDDVPARLVPVFSNYILDAPRRSERSLRALAPKGGRALLDLGCGSGGALASGAGGFAERIGVDIALRWLVIAQKRLEEDGIAASLVCADAESLPFADGRFSHVLGAFLVEHVRSPAAALKSAAGALEDGGRLYISASNGRWIGPHAATGVWAAGLLPQRFRASMLARRHGVDILREVGFVTPGAMRRMARTAGLRQVAAEPLQPELGQFDGRSALFRSLARAYSVLARLPFVRKALLLAGPVFQVIFVKEQRT